MKLFLIYSNILVGISDAVLQNRNVIKQFGICPAEETKIKTLLMLSLDDCIQECVVRPACKVIGYRRLSKMCQLHTHLSRSGTGERNCVKINMETVLTNETLRGCNGQCKDMEVCDTSLGSCIYKECKPFHQDEPTTDVFGNMNEIGSIKRVQMGSSITEYTKCLHNGLWSRLIDAMVNVALNKPAVQSSNYWLSTSASLGVDGIKIQDFYLHPCFHTALEWNPWWMVDLEYNFLVFKYVLFNRLDFEQNIRAHDIEVSIGNSTDALILVDYIPGVLPDIYNKTLTPVLLTRYVHILLRSSDINSTDYLHLCEVEVYASANVALYKPTEQSTYYLPTIHSSKFGVDGDTSQYFYTSMTCFHTEEELNPWWLVDLQDVFYISRIVLFNRLDNGLNVRTHDIEVHFGYDRTTLFLVDFIPGMLPNVYTKDLALAILTRFAKISIVSTNGQVDILHLCEVELYGVSAMFNA